MKRSLRTQVRALSHSVQLSLMLLALCVGLLPASTAGAASGDHLWARDTGGVGVDQGYGVATDSNGNVYIVGVLIGTVDFDPGPGTAELASTAGTADVFIAKFDQDGNFVWAKNMGGTGADRGQGIAVDAGGNVYTTGLFSDTADFDPGAGTFNLNSIAHSTDIFVSKLDTNGNFVWAKNMGGPDVTGYYNAGEDITVDASGNVYLTGVFEGTVDFDPGSGTAPLGSDGDDDIFVAKLDTNGNFVWAKAMKGVSVEEGYAIAVDGVGNVYTTGLFFGTVDFDPGLGTASLTSAGWSDIFVAKLDANGGFVWAKRMGSPNPNLPAEYSEGGNAISVDSSGSVYTTGTFENTADFDPGAGTASLTSAGSQDIFVSKLDANGGFVWAKGMGGPHRDYGNAIALDPQNKVLTTGFFAGTVDFDPGPGTDSHTAEASTTDAFISKLDNNITPTGDSFEPDNTPAEAKEIASGVPQTHKIVPASDVDWVKFTLPGPSVVTLETSGTTGADTRMWLFKSSDLTNEYDFNDDKDSVAGNRYSYLAYQNCNANALPPGTYYVKIDEFENNNEIPAYQLSLTATGCTPSATFSDVPLDYWAWHFIERLYAAGITGGCLLNPLSYCPEQSVTRAQMAVFLLRGRHGSSYTPPAVGADTGFGDVPPGYWSATFIKQLAVEGITSGCGGGNYCPEQPVTRAQMAVFLLKAKHSASYIPPAVGSGTGFGDVPTDYWAAAFIKQLVAEGITVGCGSGNYCPEQPVTRAQMAVFLVRTFSLP